MGWIPPDFFSIAINCPPNKIGVTAGLHFPSNSALTKAVMDVSNAEPDSRQLTRSRICCGRTPSGPPADPAGKVEIDVITCVSVTWIAVMPAGCLLDDCPMAELDVDPEA